jgi:hypothetical protein
MAQAAPVKVSIGTPPSRLQTLERKAQESDRYRTQCNDLQSTLDEMLALLPLDETEEPPDGLSGFGQLSKLLEKAAMADVLSREMKDVRGELEQVVKQRDALVLEVDTLKTERDKAVADLVQLKDESAERTKQIANMRETIERLLLGEFEYYEVKDGDSIQSIAANPMVYGDPSRTTWLRQVNDGRVKHLDHLRPGEMLVVPRFPRNGSYEF